LGGRPFHLLSRATPRYVPAMIAVSLRRLLFWAAAIFAFVMAVLPHPPDLPGSPSDKVQHVAAFATLGVLGAWAYVEASVLQLLAGLSLFGALIELVQAIPAIHRDSDVKDWIADTLACGVVLLLVAWHRARKRGGTRSTS
jgi:VanZ family protein